MFICCKFEVQVTVKQYVNPCAACVLKFLWDGKKQKSAIKENLNGRVKSLWRLNASPQKGGENIYRQTII